MKYQLKNTKYDLRDNKKETLRFSLYYLKTPSALEVLYMYFGTLRPVTMLIILNNFTPKLERTATGV